MECTNTMVCSRDRLHKPTSFVTVASLVLPSRGVSYCRLSLSPALVVLFRIWLAPSALRLYPNGHIRLGVWLVDITTLIIMYMTLLLRRNNPGAMLGTYQVVGTGFWSLSYVWKGNWRLKLCLHGSYTVSTYLPRYVKIVYHTICVVFASNGWLLICRARV